MIGVELFEDDGVALVIVPDYQLSLAIGREGQNVRLAARLTGWRLDIASEDEAKRRASATWPNAPNGRPRTAAEPPRKRPTPTRSRREGVRAAIDADLIRKLEEFRRERLGPRTKADDEAVRVQPIRQCVGCRERYPQADLMPRFVRAPEGWRADRRIRDTGSRAGAPIYARRPAVGRVAKNKRYPGLARGRGNVV